MRQWRASGLGEKSLETYITWVRRFRVLVRNEGLDELERQTLADATTFAKKYVGARRGKRVKASTRYVARNALHAGVCTLRLLGEPVPPWRSTPSPFRRSPVLAAHEEYRRCHRGVSMATEGQVFWQPASDPVMPPTQARSSRANDHSEGRCAPATSPGAAA